jgi:hypothetical protein
VIRTLNRKRFVNTIGVAGLGLGLLASAVGAPFVMAQENPSQGIDRQLFQYEDGTLDLSEEELQHLLIQLLQERAQEKGDVLAFRSDEDGKDVGNTRLQGGERGGHEALRVEAYNEFTQALADDLGIDDADEVDAAIRGAMMAVVDANDGLSKEGAEELKALITDAEAPIGPTIRGWGG